MQQLNDLEGLSAITAATLYSMMVILTGVGAYRSRARPRQIVWLLVPSVLLFVAGALAMRFNGETSRSLATERAAASAKAFPSSSD